MIELADVSYSYGEHTALAHLDLSIRRGESAAFLGPNGSGKSTLLKLINGILLPDSGSYRYDGEQIDRGRLRDQAFAKRFHQRIGFLFQNSDTQLFCPGVHDEIAFGPRQMGMEESAVSLRVADCLRLLAIEHLASRVPWHLSEGEKRKVALASVLALNPEVLVLDEPMSGLDPRARRSMREIMLWLRGVGKTILCSTHDPSDVEGLVSRGVVISADHVVARDGEFESILADSRFLAEQNIR